MLNGPKFGFAARKLQYCEAENSSCSAQTHREAGADSRVALRNAIRLFFRFPYLPGPSKGSVGALAAPK